MGGRLHNQWTAHETTIVGVDISNDGNLIVTASDDSTAKIWTSMSRETDMFRSTGMAKLLHNFKHEDFILHVAFSPDSRLLVTSSPNGAVYVWDVTSASMTAKLNGHLSSVSSIAFTPSGSHILSCSWDKTMRLWELDPTVRKTAKGHFGGSCIKIIEGHAVRLTAPIAGKFTDNHVGVHLICHDNSRCLVDHFWRGGSERAND